MRGVRSADGVRLVQRQGCLPCRHGHTTATGSGRPPDAYVREDRILAHLPGLHLLLTGGQPARRRRTRSGADTRPVATPQHVIAYLREHQITLTYHPAAHALHAGTSGATQTITLKAS